MVSNLHAISGLATAGRIHLTVWDPDALRPHHVAVSTPPGQPLPPATADMREDYAAFCWVQRQLQRQRQRQQQAEDLRAIHHIELALCHRHGFKLHRLRAWRKEVSCHARGLRAWRMLCNTRKADKFRTSLRDQLVGWLREEPPSHRSPFSPRQWRYV